MHTASQPLSSGPPPPHPPRSFSGPSTFLMHSHATSSASAEPPLVTLDRLRTSNSLDACAYNNAASLVSCVCHAMENTSILSFPRMLRLPLRRLFSTKTHFPLQDVLQCIQSRKLDDILAKLCVQPMIQDATCFGGLLWRCCVTQVRQRDLSHAMQKTLSVIQHSLRSLVLTNGAVKAWFPLIDVLWDHVTAPTFLQALQHTQHTKQTLIVFLRWALQRCYAMKQATWTMRLEVLTNTMRMLLQGLGFQAGDAFHAYQDMSFLLDTVSFLQDTLPPASSVHTHTDSLPVLHDFCDVFCKRTPAPKGKGPFAAPFSPTSFRHRVTKFWLTFLAAARKTQSDQGFHFFFVWLKRHETAFRNTKSTAFLETCLEATNNFPTTIHAELRDYLRFLLRQGNQDSPSSCHQSPTKKRDFKIALHSSPKQVSCMTLSTQPIKRQRVLSLAFNKVASTDVLVSSIQWPSSKTLD